MKKVLIVHSGNETFVKLDKNFLNQKFHIQDFYVKQPFPVNCIKYLQKIPKTDVVFCWFASWNSFWAILLSKLFNKPSILVIGGYDLADIPEADYGHQRGGIKKFFSRWAMRMATTLITNSCYSREEAEKNAQILSSKINVVYHGVPDPFSGKDEISKENVALAVGNISWPNLKRKGWEPFVKAASYLPEMQFVMAGKWADDSVQYLKSIAADNVLFPGRVSDDELHRLYLKAKVYVQASLHEGFGMTVAESMLAKCIPVVSRNGALPEVVGDCGVYLDDCKPEAIANAIRSIPESNDLGKRARQRVIKKFPPEKRIELLTTLVKDTLHHK